MRVGRIRKVALIGTGIMGAPIGGHILDAGFELAMYNRTKSKAEGLVEKGATWAESPAAAARGADLVLTMVGYPKDVEEVYLGRDGVLDGAPRGAWLVDLTTSSPALARELHEAAEVVGKHAVDCPVTGGQAGAQAGTLTLMVGATEDEAQILLPVLRTFSSAIHFMGGAGKGQATKLCNQVSLASCMVGYADALALAEAFDIDAEHMLDVVTHGMGDSRAMEQLAPKSVDGDFRPGFLSEHLRKDIALALEEGRERELTLPGAETAFTLYDTLCQIGGARLGTQALTLLYEDEAAGVAAGLDWSLLETGDGEQDTPPSQKTTGDGLVSLHGTTRTTGSREA